MNELTHLSLFTGIGGIDIAAEWAGFRTIGQVEIDPYCQRVLEKHWPGVPQWEDVRHVTAGSFREKTQKRSPLLLTGGFPCQPVSCAGKRRGKNDNRWLWPEMLRVVRELRPTWVIGENVAGIIGMALDDVLDGLEHQKYECRAFLIPALAVGAWHQRERIFIVAHAGHSDVFPHIGDELQQDLPKEPDAGGEGQLYAKDVADTTCRGKMPVQLKRQRDLIEQSCNPMADTDITRLQRHRGSGECGGELFTWEGRSPLERIWESEPGLGRVAHGIPHRVDRLRCLGNAVVPQQIFPILKAIAEIEGNCLGR